MFHATHQAILDSDAYTITSFVLWSAAAWWMWRGALRGMVGHLVPRVVLACAVTMLAITYVFNFMDLPEVATNMRRPTGWAICIGLIWTARTGIKAGEQWDEQREAVIREVLGIIRDSRDEQGDS